MLIYDISQLFTILMDNPNYERSSIFIIIFYIVKRILKVYSLALIFGIIALC